MILGIVGHEAAKFTIAGEYYARDVIRQEIRHYKPEAVASGHCHLGGIDIWTEEIAEEEGCFNPDYIFPPKKRQWKGGFEDRNIKIAVASTVQLCLVVDKLPDSYTGMRFPVCYHCARYGPHPVHVKSGGCWTMHYARKLGKETRLIVIPNVPEQAYLREDW
jgi:hypothetical protein